jgi:hypothetical protein
METSLIEIIGMMLGSGIATGGVTVAGIRVHIQYLREQDLRHQAEIETAGVRLSTVERDIVVLQGMAERASVRIDELKAAA